MPRSGAIGPAARSTLAGMRPILVALLALVTGVGAVAAAFALAPVLDPRWQTASARETSPADPLARSARAPLLFVPDSVTRDPSAPARLVVVLPGLGGIRRGMAEALLAAAPGERRLPLAPSPAHDPQVARARLQAGALRVGEPLLARIDRV